MHRDTAGVPLPQTDPVSQALDQLVELKPQCLYCGDELGSIDFIVAWPAADVVAHFACYAKAQRLIKRPAPPSDDCPTCEQTAKEGSECGDCGAVLSLVRS